MYWYKKMNCDMNMKNMRSLSLYITVIMGSMAIIYGCRPAQEIARKPAVHLPASYNGKEDTANIANLDWRRFFTDPYLTGLIDTALQQNWDLLSAAQKVEMLRAQYLQTSGTLKPSIEANATAGFDKYGDHTMNGVGNYDTNLSGNLDKDQKIPTPLTPDYFLGLKSTWEIDLWGKLKNRKSAAFHRLLSSHKAYQLAHTLVVAEVARSYYELLALDNALVITRKNIQLQQDATDIVRVQKEAGRATELAVQQFTAQLLRTKSLESDLQQRITATENNLNMLLGRLPQPIARSQSFSTEQLPPALHAGVPSALLLHRPDIQQAELALKAANEDISAARAAFLPSLTLTPYMGLNAFSAAFLLNPGAAAYGLLGGLSAPILNRSMLKGQYQQTLAASQQAYYEYQKAITNGYREVITDLSGIQNLKKKFQLKKQEAQILGEAINSANLLYRAGRATYLEVISAQQNVVEAELNVIDSKKELFITLIDLYRSLGGGWN